MKDEKNESKLFNLNLNSNFKELDGQESVQIKPGTVKFKGEEDLIPVNISQHLANLMAKSTFDAMGKEREWVNDLYGKKIIRGSKADIEMLFKFVTDQKAEKKIDNLQFFQIKDLFDETGYRK